MRKLFVLALQQALNIAVRERHPPPRGRRISSTFCTHRALTGAVFFKKSFATKSHRALTN
jgi:hypothetical protein